MSLQSKKTRQERAAARQEKQPANADFSYHLGLAYARNGDNVKAKETLQAALKANPNAPLAGDAKSELARLGS